MTFKNKYLEIKNLFSEELDAIKIKMVASISTCEPLNSDLLKFLKSPSKRIRSVIALLYLKSQGFEITDSVLELLSAVEIVHNASLIHDDIIDDSEFRRGEKAINVTFGNKLGVISGDYLLAVAMEKIAELENPKILAEFSKALKQMCLGEINQNFNRFQIGTIESYIEKSKDKTGWLFEIAVICSLLLCGVNIEASRNFGLNVGIAFQIRDDLLNILKKDATKPATDIDEGIYTAPVIYAGSVEKYLEGVEKTKVLLNNYIEQSKKYVANFENNVYTQQLIKLLEALEDE